MFSWLAWSSSLVTAKISTGQKAERQLSWSLNKWGGVCEDGVAEKWGSEEVELPYLEACRMDKKAFSRKGNNDTGKKWSWEGMGTGVSPWEAAKACVKLFQPGVRGEATFLQATCMWALGSWTSRKEVLLSFAVRKLVAYGGERGKPEYFKNHEGVMNMRRHWEKDCSDSVHWNLWCDFHHHHQKIQVDYQPSSTGASFHSHCLLSTT